MPGYQFIFRSLVKVPLMSEGPWRLLIKVHEKPVKYGKAAWFADDELVMPSAGMGSIKTRVGAHGLQIAP